MRLLALAAGLMAGAILSSSIVEAAPVDDVEGAAAVVTGAKKRKTVRVIARLATPDKAASKMAPATISQQASGLARTLGAVGVKQVSPIKGLPLVDRGRQ